VSGPEDSPSADAHSVVETVAESDPDTFRSEASPGAADDLRLQAGQQVGRYIVLEPLGAGAVGVVYAAYDPELDRRVAMKLLRPQRVDRLDSSTRRTRLMREAQALARLSHPNVVAVHDVGTFEGRVYVAMEFIEGKNLRVWLRQGSAERSEVLRIFEQAGRGLAAAHAAGLIHRDFKPANVIVGVDGRVKVLDFGLARAADIERASTGRNDSVSIGQSELVTGSGALSIDLTKTGGIMGTPAYMSPEQHLGLEVTAASDQFGFCVTLYEALYGERPFRGKSLPDLALSVTGGEVRPAPADSRVPNWLRRVLLRGLKADPSDRFSDMAQLLAALRADPNHKYRRWGLWGAGLAVLAGAFAVARAPAGTPDDPCGGGNTKMSELWDAGRGEALRTSFETTKLPYAGHSADVVVATLDAWAEAWVVSHRDACEDTRVRHEQSDTLMDRRMACLGNAFGEVEALVERLDGADAELVERSVEAVDGLPMLSRCEDADRLMAGRAPLEGDAKRAADEIAGELDQVRADIRVGDYSAGLERALALEPDVTELDDPSTNFRFADAVATLRGASHDDDRELARLREAYLAADRGGDDFSRVELGTRIMQTLGYDKADYEGAAQWDQLTRGALERIGSPDPLRARVDVARGTVALKRGDYQEAIALLRGGAQRLGDIDDGSEDHILAIQRLAVALREKGELDEAAGLDRRHYEWVVERVGPKHPKTAGALGSLANLAYARGKYDESVELHERALTILAPIVGEDSPRYADALNNYAAALWAVGRIDEAAKIHHDNLTRKETLYGEDDIRLTPTLENLGNVLIAQNRNDEARRYLERSLAIKRAVHGADHPSTAMSEMNLGVTLFQLGDLDAAERLYDHTMKVWSEKLGPDHADVGLVHTNLGDVAQARGRYRAAAEHHQKALDRFEPVWGKDAADLGWPLTGLGVARLGLGDQAGAREALERARRVRGDTELPEGERGRMDFAYARTLAEEDPQRAAALATTALADAKKGDAELAASIEAWLKR
jgi:tetratricopeptide (TPR) repeat protein/tRNA A-37 threonylcarbamoyl transferase component Bud32